MEVEALTTYAEFKVIDIFDDIKPYPTLLEIYWAIDNQTIIYFKKMILSFEDSEIRVVAPIDLLQGQRYVKPIHRKGKDNYVDQL